ncbi:MAG: oligosaccharide flippase family protein, partial [Sulfurovaceae bacterium]|nr:oligosaccharide flippase family protein [Sulfurovaceae bacterium]
MSLLKKGLSDSRYYLIANIGNKLLAFLIIPILAKSISVEDFATYDLFLLITVFLNIFVILGIDSGIGILLSESQNDDKQLSFLYVSSLLISFSVISIISTILGVLF